MTDLVTRRWVVLAVTAAIIALGLVAQFSNELNGDSAFFLYASGRVLDGARMYVDLLEINPPLIVWLNLPVVKVARALEISEVTAFRTALVCLLLASLAASRAVLRNTTEGRDDSLRRILLLLVAFGLFVLPRLDFGEREHIALALMLPWLVLAVSRSERTGVSRGLAIGSGLAAGVGIALKPHFVLVWLARELAMGWDQASARERLRAPDSFLPPLVCAAYLAVTVAIVPEYFRQLELLAGPYAEFIRTRWFETLLGPAPAVAMASVILGIGLRRVRRYPALRRVVIFAVVAWAAAAMLQAKGFRYHWYPAMALGLVALWVIWRAGAGEALRGPFRLFRATALAAGITVLLAGTADSVRQIADPTAPEWDSDPSLGLLRNVLESRVAPGDTLVVLSPNMGSGFPLTNYLQTVWPLRLTNIWPAIVAYRDPLDAGEPVRLRPSEDMLSLERWAVNVVTEDLVRSRPEWVVLFRHFDHPDASYMARLNLRAFLDRDATFSQLWSGYDSLGTVGMYTLWHRRTAGPATPLAGDVQWPVSRRASPVGGLAIAPGSAAYAMVFALALSVALFVTSHVDSAKPAPT